MAAFLFFTACVNKDISTIEVNPSDTPILSGPTVDLSISPFEDHAILKWRNPQPANNARISSILIKIFHSNGSFTEMEFSGSLAANVDISYNATNLDIGIAYRFELVFTYSDNTIGETLTNITRKTGRNQDGDDRIDVEDAFPNDPNETMDSDNDTVGDNADAFPTNPSESEDNDSDNIGNNADIDDDGDGLIEVFTAAGMGLANASLDHIRYQLDGTALTNSINHTRSEGCGNGQDIEECFGYELMNNIDITTDWIPIGGDLNSTDGLCLGDGAFTSVFEGNGHTINLMNIDSNDCTGFFAQLKGAEVRNLTISVQNIMGTKNVGVLAGWGQDSTITNVHTKSTLLKGVQAVGGLIGRIQLDDGEAIVAEAEAANRTGTPLPIIAELATSPSIKNSSATSTEILACASAGGLVGESDRIMIQDSYAISKKIELPSNQAAEIPLLGFDCSTIRVASITHHIYKSVGGLVGDGDSSLWKGSNWDSYPDLVEHIVVNIGDYLSSPNTDTNYPKDGISTTTYGDLDLMRIVNGGTRVVSSYAISGNLTGNWKIAGLVGDLQDGEASRSYAVSKNIQARIRTASGLIGQADNTNIFASYAIAGLVDANGSTTGEKDGDKANGEAGGLVGRARVVVVNASYAISESIIGGQDASRTHLGSAAGLLGSRFIRDMDDNIDIKIFNSYAAFNEITGAQIRPLVGRDTLTNVEINSSYWDTNATPISINRSKQPNRFYQTDDSSNLNAQTSLSLKTGLEVMNPNDNPLMTVADSDIFSNWKNATCYDSGQEKIWDLGNNEEYPAIRCVPDKLPEQRQWYFFNSQGIIQVNKALIDERINAKLNE